MHPTPDKKPWWKERFINLWKHDFYTEESLSIEEIEKLETFYTRRLVSMTEFISEVASTTRAEAMRECVEMVRAMKATTSCQPDKSDPPASHEFIEPCDFRSECKRCGIEKQDTEDASYNTACSDIALSIESRIKE